APAPQPAAQAAAPHAPAPAAVANGAASTPLPRDPLRGAANAVAPVPARWLARLAALPVVALLVYWLALAVQHARRNDPRRPQREAFRRLAPAIERVRRATTAAERIDALLAWQRTAVIALGIDRAAPTAEQLRNERWAAVWADSERALFGRAHELPRGWGGGALTPGTRTRPPPLH